MIVWIILISTPDLLFILFAPTAPKSLIVSSSQAMRIFISCIDRKNRTFTNFPFLLDIKKTMFNKYNKTRDTQLKKTFTK